MPTSPVSIPRDLLPADGRFGCGPSRVRTGQVTAVTAAGNSLTSSLPLLGTSHRQAPIKNIVGSIRSGLGELFAIPDGYEVVLGDGGASALWDAVSFGLVEKRAQAVTFGEFGSKLAHAVAAPWLTAPDIRSAQPGTLAIASPVAGVDVYAWPHNETSTGVASPVLRVGGADSGALMVVDATSAAGGIAVDIAETDVYYFSPQKNFGSDGGLWFAIVSPAAVERIDRIAASGRYIPEFLSLAAALTNSRLNQTLNTPALASLIMVNNQIEWILANGGLRWATARTKESSGLLYDWAEADQRVTPFVAEPSHRSPVVVTIDFDESIDAKAVAATLRANGIVDVEPYRKLGRNQLRIGTFVSVPPEDVRLLVASITWVLDNAAVSAR